jgi:hypothetical protein
MPLSKGPGGEPDELREQDYYSRFLGVDKPRDDARYEPELQELLSKLYGRQRGEAHDLLEEQTKDLEQVEDYRRIGDPDLREEFRGHLDDDAVAEEHYKAKIAQQDRFAEERERYISEYQATREIRDEMQQEQETLEQGREDNPKLTY